MGLREMFPRTGREMTSYKSGLESDSLELPPSSWWIARITVLTTLLAVVMALL
jgi:hypothetical protein